MYPGNSSYNHGCGQTVFKNGIPYRFQHVEDLVVELLVSAVRMHRVHVVACQVSVMLNQTILQHRNLMRKTVLGCISSSSSSLSKKQDEDGFLRIENADFPINPLKLDVKSSMECESASLSNCSWIAYAFDERIGSCFVWDNKLFDLKKLIQGDSN
ncbi:hypothetical protein Q3G72_022714 [Acer saccharum]|nr:hypothetical protein Q3G72_022714 [Acer saccharum]